MELLVVIGIIALLVAILLPALNKARQEAQTVQCMSNEKQLGMCFLQYMNDNAGHLFPYYWQNGSNTLQVQMEWQVLLLYYMVPESKKYNLYGDSQSQLASDVGKLAGIGSINCFLCPTASLPNPGNSAGTNGSGSAFYCWGPNSAGNGQAVAGLNCSYDINGWLYRLHAGGDDQDVTDYAGNGPSAITAQQQTIKLNGVTQTLSNSQYEFWQLPYAGMISTTVPLVADGVWVDGWPLETDFTPAGGFSGQITTEYTGTLSPNMGRYCIARHNGGKYTNVVFLDGHAETASLKNLWTYSWHKNWNQYQGQQVGVSGNPYPNP